MIALFDLDGTLFNIPLNWKAYNNSDGAEKINIMWDALNTAKPRFDFTNVLGGLHCDKIVVSNNQKAEVESLVKTWRLDRYFVGFVSSAFKPDPSVLINYLHQEIDQWWNQEYIVVGDRHTTDFGLYRNLMKSGIKAYFINANEIGDKIMFDSDGVSIPRYEYYWRLFDEGA